MIGRLKGRVEEISGNSVILDVGGVGYVVSVGARTLAALGGVGEAASLAIETIVREDAITLYGFADRVEQAWFKTLTTVQGVGPKVAVAILSACTPDQLALAIGAKDPAILTRADGVGPKLAQRIVMELKGKAPAVPVGAVAMTALPKGKGVQKTETPAPADFTEDAISALVNLGYGRAEAYSAVNTVVRRGDASDVGAAITQSLKELAA